MNNKVAKLITGDTYKLVEDIPLIHMGYKRPAICMKCEAWGSNAKDQSAASLCGMLRHHGCKGGYYWVKIDPIYADLLKAKEIGDGDK
jgi:hypothetical protein